MNRDFAQIYDAIIISFKGLIVSSQFIFGALLSVGGRAITYMETDSELVSEYIAHIFGSLSIVVGFGLILIKFLNELKKYKRKEDQQENKDEV